MAPSFSSGMTLGHVNLRFLQVNVVLITLGYFFPPFLFSLPPRSLPHLSLSFINSTELGSEAVDSTSIYLWRGGKDVEERLPSLSWNNVGFLFFFQQMAPYS